VEDSSDEGEHVEAKKNNSNQRSEGEVGTKREKKKKTSEKESTSEQKVTEDIGNNELSKEGLLEILKEILVGMTGVISMLNEQMQQPGESQDASAARFKKLYDSRIKAIREEIFKKHKTSEEHCTQALQVYMNDEDVKKVCIQIERINKALHCTPLTETELSKIPESFTIDRLIEMMKEIQKKTTDAQRKFMNEARQNPNANANETLNVQYQGKLMQLQKKIFGKYSVTEEIITLAMQKYGNEPKLQAAMMKMQQEQAAEFQQMQSYDTR